MFLQALFWPSLDSSICSLCIFSATVPKLLNQQHSCRGHLNACSRPGWWRSGCPHSGVFLCSGWPLQSAGTFLPARSPSECARQARGAGQPAHQAFQVHSSTTGKHRPSLSHYPPSPSLSQMGMALPCHLLECQTCLDLANCTATQREALGGWKQWLCLCTRPPMVFPTPEVTYVLLITCVFDL